MATQTEFEEELLKIGSMLISPDPQQMVLGDAIIRSQYIETQCFYRLKSYNFPQNLYGRKSVVLESVFQKLEHISILERQTKCVLFRRAEVRSGWLTLSFWLRSNLHLLWIGVYSSEEHLLNCHFAIKLEPR
jgi:hypothetical protein